MRIGIYLVPDLVLTLVMLVFIPKRWWHPITALVTSILWFGLWLCACFFNILLIESNEIPFDNVRQWYNWGYAEGTFQALIAVMYVIMMVFAAHAVHRWRMRPSRNAVEEGTATVLKVVSQRTSVS